MSERTSLITWIFLAGCLEDDVDLVARLFLSTPCVATTGCRSSSGCRNRSGRSHAERCLEFLDELAELRSSQLLECVKALRC